MYALCTHFLKSTFYFISHNEFIRRPRPIFLTTVNGQMIAFAVGSIPPHAFIVGRQGRVVELLVYATPFRQTQTDPRWPNGELSGLLSY